ncbi:hypothetical protein L195_g004689, partial [Trifolium pratense]
SVYFYSSFEFSVWERYTFTFRSWFARDPVAGKSCVFQYPQPEYYSVIGYLPHRDPPYQKSNATETALSLAIGVISF